MRAPNEIVFLFDVGNTLLDNDCVQDDLTKNILRAVRSHEPESVLDTI